jgi:predicted enzyme related to lactoylglutathione lyase
MARGEVFPIINCEDLQTTKRFYRHVFGAEQSYEFVHEGQEVYVTLDIGAGKLALGLGTGPAMYGETPLPASGHAVDLCVYTPDLDAAVAAAPDAGGRVVMEPQQMPWGERVAYLQDPTGTMVLTIQDELRR